MSYTYQFLAYYTCKFERPSSKTSERGYFDTLGWEKAYFKQDTENINHEDKIDNLSYIKIKNFQSS